MKNTTNKSYQDSSEGDEENKEYFRECDSNVFDELDADEFINDEFIDDEFIDESEKFEDLGENQEEDGDISCYLAFHLTTDDDLVFDAAWSTRNDIPKLAKIIYIIQNSDFIMENIREMETENREDVEFLQQIIEGLNDRPVIYPSDVYREDSD